MKARIVHARYFRFAAIALLAALATACSKRSEAPAEEPWLPQAGEVVRGEVTTGGIASRYAAYFDNDQLQRIGEVRKTQRESTGDYTFTGARLVQYKGDALGSDSAIELTFDMHGVLTSSSGAADEKEVAAIRTRAELLRSLALTRRTSMQHAQ